MQSIDVGPSISQKCASDNCTYAEMVQISQQLYCALNTAVCGAMVGRGRGEGENLHHDHDHGHGLRTHETKSSDLVTFPPQADMIGRGSRARKKSSWRNSLSLSRSHTMSCCKDEMGVF